MQRKSAGKANRKDGEVSSVMLREECEGENGERVEDVGVRGW